MRALTTSGARDYRVAVDDPAKAQTRRQQRARETRAKIFDAATELIAAQGYHATSVDRIAARAGVAKATFFVHFASKAEVIAALMRLQTATAHEARAKALPEGPIAALRATVESLGRLAAKSRTLSRGVLAATLESEELGGAASALFDEVLAEMTADAHAAQKAGLLAPGVEPDTLASSLLASYFGALLTVSHKPKANMRAVLASLVDTTLRGSCLPASPAGTRAPTASTKAASRRARLHE